MSRDLTKAQRDDLSCPLCGEQNFDPIGLYLHYTMRWCDDFDQLEADYRAEEYANSMLRHAKLTALIEQQKAEPLSGGDDVS